MKFKDIHMVTRLILDIEDMVMEMGMMEPTRTANTKTFMMPKTENIIQIITGIKKMAGVSQMLVRLLHHMIQIHILRRHIMTTISTDGALHTGTE